MGWCCQHDSCRGGPRGISATVEESRCKPPWWRLKAITACCSVAIRGLFQCFTFLVGISKLRLELLQQWRQPPTFSTRVLQSGLCSMRRFLKLLQNSVCSLAKWATSGTVLMPGSLQVSVEMLYCQLWVPIWKRLFTNVHASRLPYRLFKEQQFCRAITSSISSLLAVLCKALSSAL